MANPELTPEYVRQIFGDPQELTEKLERFKQDALFFGEHREELRITNPDQFIAIKNLQVVGTNANLEKLLPQLKERGVKPSESFITFLPSVDIPMIFAAA